MTLLTPQEFAQMERLLADLLPHTRSEEEAALLQLHARLQVIYEAQSGLNASRDVIALSRWDRKIGDDVTQLCQILAIAAFGALEFIPHQLRLRPVHHITLGQLILKPVAQGIEALPLIGHDATIPQVSVDDAGCIHVLAPMSQSLSAAALLGAVPLTN